MQALAGLMTLSHNTGATYAVLTDELTSVILTFNQCKDITSIPFLTVKLSTDVQLRLMIAACIHYVAATWGLVRISSSGDSHPVQGALNEPSSFYRHDETCQLAERKWLSDFDLYTMQRVSEVWWNCYLWHEKAQKDALKKPIVEGSQILFEPRGFERRCGLLRSPYPTQHIPKETADVLTRWTSRKRPRSHVLDEILGSPQVVTLTITKPVRTGPRHYSQVVYGRIEGCDEIFCIKLFDERFFSIPWADDPECVMGRPETRLLALSFSEDLARREESVYDRLHELQGSLLPHCYGFHMASVII